MNYLINKRQVSILCYILILCISFSCKKGNLKTSSASYIVVNTTVVSSNILSLKDSHRITDIWLYVNDKFQGVYPIGSVMPVITSGAADIKMYGGIENNGISSTRLPYTFYNSYSFTLNFEEHKTYTITPEFRYKENLVIKPDDFDAGGSFYLPTGDSTYALIADPAKVWGGSGHSVFMSMSDAKPTAGIQASAPQYLPVGGVDAYLELDYKCNQEVTVGLICGDGIETRPVLTLRPSTEWKKIYVSLTSAASTQPTYNYYKVYISAFKESGVDHPEIYLDNIRLITP